MGCTCTKYRHPHLKVTNEKGSVCVLVRSSTGELMDTAAIRRENERRKTVRYRMGALATPPVHPPHRPPRNHAIGGTGTHPAPAWRVPPPGGAQLEI